LACVRVTMDGSAGAKIGRVVRAGESYQGKQGPNYIPAGVPHVAVNRSATPALFVGARSDPNEQESVVMRPDLEAQVP
jgi:mannose-6-phosphate isomerase-like protein (cupin superfamily)